MSEDIKLWREKCLKAKQKELEIFAKEIGIETNLVLAKFLKGLEEQLNSLYIHNG